MKRVTLDIETNDLLANMLDYSQLPYKLNNCAKLWCVVIRDVDSGDVVTLKSEIGCSITKEKLMVSLDGVTEVIAHNGIKFDLIALKLFGVLDYEVGYLDQPDLIFGNPVKITDTLVRSRLLNPARYGGHSLKAWGERLGDYKDDFRQQSVEAGYITNDAPKGDEFRQYSELMVKYCEQDTKVTVGVFKELEQEFAGYVGWKKAERLENKLADLAIKRETYGFSFDKDLAVKCLEDLTEKMQELSDRVNPILPPKPMNKTRLKYFTAPSVQIKKDQTLSAHMLSFIEKHNGKHLFDNTYDFYGKSYTLPITQPLITSEPATIADLDHVKMFLIKLGWSPTEFKVRDLTKDHKKQSINYEKRVKALDTWLTQTFDDGKYKLHRLKELDMGDDRDVIRKKLLVKLSDDKPVRVPTSPCVRVGVEKELCPNLVKLGDKVSFANDFTLYLTYKHRKSSIAGGDIEDMDFDDETPNTGFLSMYREVDGRIPTPAIEIGASTNRYRHIGVCNVARASSIYGKEMRSLFGCGKGMYQLGFDFSSLEARIQGHYILPFDGDELAEQLLASKPNDIHCYSEDTEVLTDHGWKTFGKLSKLDKVAQWWEDGSIDFVTPSEVVWQKYRGKMYTFNNNNVDFKVTPNHRMVYKRKHTGKVYEVLANNFSSVFTSDIRIPLGGSFDGDKEISESFLKLAVAVQADGSFAKDCSAITLQFKRQDKVNRLVGLLEDLQADYSLNHYNRGITSIRLKSSNLTIQLREFLPNKEFSNVILMLAKPLQQVFLHELQYWDGTKTSSGIVVDTTSEASVDVIQAVGHLNNVKVTKTEFAKKTTYGICKIYRAFVSTKANCASGVLTMRESVEDYDGFIGCVSVPSTYIVVRRNGKVVVSGNTINGKKLGIARDQAKSVSYMLMYGGSANRAKSMLGISMREADSLVKAYWDAVKPLSDLRDAVSRKWKERGSKFVIGVDGRKIMTRSQHSLLNALFQSGGVICAKYTTVFIYQILEEQGYKCDPFKHSELDVCGMIEYHDECQLSVNPKLITLKKFTTEDECNKFKETWGGEQLGSEVKMKSGKLCLALPNPVSKAISKAIELAEKEVKLKVPLGMEWVVANNWYNCH